MLQKACAGVDVADALARFLHAFPPHRFESLLLETKTPPAGQARRGSEITGGELGIRTLDALVGHTHLAGEHLRPLGQLSEK